jgi:hypothetical protein
MPRFLIDLPMPLAPSDRLENFLQTAAASPLHEDPVVQAAVGRVQGYLRDRQASIEPPRHKTSA